MATPGEELWEDILPAALRAPVVAYRHRHRLHRWWTNVVEWIGVADTRIVVTGRSAVGKSYLTARMKEESSRLDWTEPGVSRTVESHVITVGSWAKILRVVPGSDIRERDLALHEAFARHGKLEGVIHVVDWGFTPVREEAARAALIKESGIETTEQLRKEHLKRELEDFRYVSKRMQESYARAKRPAWLMVAVNKADLYLDRLNQAQLYYHPDSRGPFGELVRQVWTSVGSQNMAVSVRPVSAWTEPFEWNGEITETQIGGEANSRALLRSFLAELSELADAT